MYNNAEQQSLFNLSKSLLQKDITVIDIEDLRKVLIFHEWKYAVKNDPVISDFEYDSLYKKLEKLESDNPELIVPHSPTQRVSSDLSSNLESVAHLIPMLSLANSYNAEDLKEFDKQIRKLALLEGDIEYVVEPKFDGGSIALIYENDILVRAATRGNGTRGEEMTNNAKVMKSIPLRANFKNRGIQRIELRGEALIRKDQFNKINELREAEGLSLFANARNAATGGLRMKDPKESEARKLEAFIFQLAYAEDEQGEELKDVFGSHFESIKLLNELGFKVPVNEIKLCKNIDEVASYCLEWADKRESYPYEIDGMVIKVNQLDIQNRVGSTAHHPRWAIAYKFKAKQATSILQAVEYQVGKIGAITPVAKIEPVHLAGVTVSSISLHNEEFIKSKDLRIGDSVLVERAGDVIPYIVKSFPELRNGSEEEVIFPTNCPSCQTLLEKPENEAAWRCPNYFCEEQVLQRMIFHVSKDAMDIDGFGKSYILKFYELGWIKDLADIYNLNYDQIAELEGFGEKSAFNLKSAIDKAKKNPISRLLHSLSIHHLGKKASKLLAQEINHVLDLISWDEENFTNIKDIGPVVAQNVMAYFSDQSNIDLLRKMEDFGVNLNQTEADKPLVVDESAPLIGKTILFTGTLQKMGRKEAQKLAENAGAKNISAVSSNLDILVAGEKAGSKLSKAQKLGTVEIISEEAFLEIINRES